MTSIETEEATEREAQSLRYVGMYYQEVPINTFYCIINYIFYCDREHQRDDQ